MLSVIDRARRTGVKKASFICRLRGDIHYIHTAAKILKVCGESHPNLSLVSSFASSKIGFMPGECVQVAVTTGRVQDHPKVEHVGKILTRYQNEENQDEVCWLELLARTDFLRL